MKKRGSLKAEVNAYLKSEFSDFLRSQKLSRRLTEKINSRRGIVYILPTLLLAFLTSQIIHPRMFEIIPLPFDSAKIIIDQRITNLVTIFSITLVVIGWLLTNNSVKESLSYQLLFKKTYLYPIFYYVITLLGCLIVLSLLRHIKGIDLGQSVVAGTYLIIAALCAITFLFIRLIDVIGKSFFFNSLENEVIAEFKSNSISIIIEKTSRSIYSSTFDELGYIKGIPFMADLTDHIGIIIIPGDNDHENSVNASSRELRVLDSPLENESYYIKDVNISKILSSLKNLKLESDNYYLPIFLYVPISQGYSPIYLNALSKPTGEITKDIKNCYKIAKRRKQDRAVPDTPYRDYLNEQFLNAVNEGKTSSIEQIQSIYSQLYDLEFRINSIEKK